MWLHYISSVGVFLFTYICLLMLRRKFEMKVFVYSKSTKKKLEQINDVVSVACFSDKQEVLVLTGDGKTLKYDGSVVKTTTYQG